MSNWQEQQKQVATGVTDGSAKQEHEVDWKDMYEKEKRRSAMWIAKYEKDIGPLEYAVPAKQEQGEPVAWLFQDRTWTNIKAMADDHPPTVPVYTTPQQRTWVGLTDDEFEDIEMSFTPTNKIGAMMAVEAKLKEKNT